ncbi:carbonate dehydratase [Teredinibacter turnerae]|uniref:Carbonic anhydrase 2 n=1 Tax=Teredinibacter turnerae (strain ATCC 39867 / T7901) TaxID=377629 RepID=C5BNH4_TERTT|nr:carbonate dehydratase [Teredinibacter turnerae]ACR10915.1 carbonate dehydratase [Teredinibacter turnerae T7901]
MEQLDTLFQNNRAWAEAIKAEDPEFFEKLAKQQSPEYLWIGCADSRVPANEIVGLLPGELFVHRNIANCVVHTDLNCLSVIHYAIEILKIKHIIVCGHYGCGGVQAALQNQQYGLADHWVRNIRDVYYNNRKKLDGITDDKERVDRLCEINVKQQVANVCHIPVVQNAWASGQSLAVHGWIYSIQDGLLRNITSVVDSLEDVPDHYRVTEA